MNRRRFLASAAIVLPHSVRASRLHAQPQAEQVNGERLNRMLSELSQFGRNTDGGIDRVAYSEADRSARDWVTQRMREAGLSVRTDAAANLIGRRDGRDSSATPIMFGSHIDSVPGGGNYDGQVGSMAAIEVAHSLADANTTLRHSIEVVIFQNEENGKVGSRAMRGEDPGRYLDLMTHSGKTIREGIRFLGGDATRLESARRAPGSIHAYFELHIEQGAILDRSGTEIGVVEGIVGIKRWQVTVEGFANHAGTTPMDQRRDALLAAAKFIDVVNRVATAEPGRQVATVGLIEAEPGAPNVIAGRARFTLEMRDLDLNKVDRIFAAMRTESERISRDTDTTFAFEEIYRTLPAQADERVRRLITAAAQQFGYSTMSLPSGAGHDAQEIARLAPMGMIFVPSRDGISHSPLEFTPPESITKGANVLLHAIQLADQIG